MTVFRTASTIEFDRAGLSPSIRLKSLDLTIVVWLDARYQM